MTVIQYTHPLHGNQPEFVRYVQARGWASKVVQAKHLSAKGIAGKDLIVMSPVCLPLEILVAANKVIEVKVPLFGDLHEWTKTDFDPKKHTAREFSVWSLGELE